MTIIHSFSILLVLTAASVAYASPQHTQMVSGSRSNLDYILALILVDQLTIRDSGSDELAAIVKKIKNNEKIIRKDGSYVCLLAYGGCPAPQQCQPPRYAKCAKYETCIGECVGLGAIPTQIPGIRSFRIPE
jgi:hypothetical protein